MQDEMNRLLRANRILTIWLIVESCWLIGYSIGMLLR